MFGITSKIRGIFFRRNTRLGNGLWQSGSPGRALIFYRRAIKWNSNSSTALHNLAGCLDQIGQWEEAVVAYRQAIKINPDFSWSHQGLAEVLCKLGEWENTAAAANKAIELNPEYFGSLNTRGDALFHQGNLEKAMEAYQKAHTLNPDSPWPRHGIAEVFAKEDRLQEATAQHQQIIAFKPEFSWSHHALGDLYYKEKLWEAAEKHYKQAIQFNPGFMWSHHGLAEVLSRMECWEQAIDEYRHAILLSPDSAWTYFCLGKALLCTDNPDEAEAAYRNAAKIDPDMPFINEALDEVLQFRTQFDELISYCAEAENHAVDMETINKRPLRILMITPYPPYPANSGGAIRVYEKIKFLGTRHELVVVTFSDGESNKQIKTALNEYCKLSLLVPRGTHLAPREEDEPAMVHQNTRKDLWRVLEKLSTVKFDAILFEFVYTAAYRQLFQQSFTVLEEHNIESTLLKQSLEMECSNLDKKTEDAGKMFENPEIESALLQAYENCVWPLFSLRTVVSEDDKLSLQARCTGGETLVVRNGVDSAGIEPVEYNEAGDVLFMGHMGYYPNVDAVAYFIEEILPVFQLNNSAITFHIAGRDPSTAIKELATNPMIKVSADPEDMGKVAAHCSVTVVPLRMGSGTRLKILHSMAMGLPVVSTSLGCEGLSVMDGEHLLVADSPDEFANAVMRIRTDNKLRNRLRINGRLLAKTAYSWDGIFSEYETELRQHLRQFNAGNGAINKHGISASKTLS